MKRSYREQLIAVVTFLAGVYFFVEFVLPKKFYGYQFGLYHEQISNGFVVVGAMAVGLGLINLLTVHGIAILKTRKGWPYSAALLLGLGIMMFFEIAAFVQSQKAVRLWSEIGQLTKYEERVFAEKDLNSAQPRVNAALDRIDELILNTSKPDDYLYLADESKRLEFVETLESIKKSFLAFSLYIDLTPYPLMLQRQMHHSLVGPKISRPIFVENSVAVARKLAKEIVDERINNSTYKSGATFLYKAFFVPLGAAMFSLLAFYVASAAYRTFRIRSMEAAIMMFAALIVMLGQIPHGPLYISPKLVPIRLWLLENLSTPAFRAIFFGSVIAGLAMAVRMWLSLERSPLDSED